MSTSGLRKTNDKARGKVRLSLRRGGISGQIDTTITDPEGILPDNLDLRLLRWLTLMHQALEKIKNELYFK